MNSELVISKEPTSLPLTGFHVGSTPCKLWRHQPDWGNTKIHMNTELQCPVDEASMKRNDTTYTQLLNERNEFTSQSIEDENGVSELF